MKATNFQEVRKIFPGFILGVLLLLPLLFVQVAPVSADYIEPGSVTLHTSAYRPDNIYFEPGKYEYSIRWQGLPVATAKIEIGKDEITGGQGFVRVKVKTASAIDLLYKLRHQSEGRFQLSPFRPVSYSFAQKENSKEKNRSIEFRDGGRIFSRQWKPGHPAEELLFLSENLTLDPISAAFLARSLPLELGKKIDLDVFNGKHRFLITFLVAEKKEIKIDGKKIPAFRVEPSVQRLTDSNPETRLKSASLWISADENRDVLKLESKVWIGSVTATLVAYEPAPVIAAPTLMSAKLVEDAKKEEEKEKSAD